MLDNRFRRELTVKSLENGFSVSLRGPYDGVCIVVHDNSDIFVSLSVTCFVNSDTNQTVEPFCSFGFDDIEDSGNAPSDGFPVDPHELGDDTSRKVNGQPADHHIEILREMAAVVSPGNICGYDTMLGTVDSMSETFDFDLDGAPVRGAP